jgi:hypothetical protein
MSLGMLGVLDEPLGVLARPMSVAMPAIRQSRSGLSVAGKSSSGDIPVAPDQLEYHAIHR